MTQVSSLYLHVPFCKHLCNYCDFYKQKLTNPNEQFDGFHQFLRESWQQHESLMQKHDMAWSPLDTLYFGGGTPSLWGIEGATFWKNFFPLSLKPGSEFTMEVDPGTWSKDMLLAWQDLGLNRISMGTQSLNPDFLKIMDRVHGLDDSLSLLKYCHANDWNFSMDFLLGVPFSREKKRDIKQELNILLAYYPKHISLYILNARSKYPHISSIPDDEYIRDEYLLVSEHLKSHGFHHYEVSNFAKPGFESRHNLKYWRSESVAALGPTGTGLFSFDSHSALRYKWKVSKADMELEELGAKELNLEKVYLTLRTSEGWMPELTPKLEKTMKGWEALNYGKFSDGKMRLNSLGYIMLDSLMDDLFKAGL